MSISSKADEKGFFIYKAGIEMSLFFERLV